MNDVDVRHSTHHDAVVAIISAPLSVIIDVRHDPQPSGLQVALACLLSCLYCCLIALTKPLDGTHFNAFETDLR